MFPPKHSGSRSHPQRPSARSLLIGIACAFSAAGCASMYYQTMESMGIPKRRILSDRVVKARREQEQAKETFESALERFRSVVASDAGQLERTYNTLNAALGRCESRAQGVSARIDAIEEVAGALFREWEGELSHYQDQNLRRQSEHKLGETRGRYDQLLSAMHRAEDKMQPVLGAFREQVLFLKHNLNAAAIASLQGEVMTIERNVADLIAEMERAIAEADAFIAQGSA